MVFIIYGIYKILLVDSFKLFEFNAIQVADGTWCLTHLSAPICPLLAEEKGETGDRESGGVAWELPALLSTGTRSPYELFIADTHFSFFSRNIKMQTRIKCGIDSSSSVMDELC